MNIGRLNFDVPIFLAPMAGVTDTAYRIIAGEMGCPLVYAEMVSAAGINYRNGRTLEMLKTEPQERPLAMQLFGSDPVSVAKAASFVESLNCCDIIDFNMGCPAPKIVKNGEGSALMRDPERAFAILRAMVSATTLPVTVKIRKGWSATEVNAVEIARMAELAGVSAIAVHGRTREDFYRGRADWDIIRAVKEAVKVPVIASGDVRTPADLDKVLATTKADAVMIGRAAQGNPWIFRELSEYYRTGQVPPPPTPQERAAVIMRHLDLLLRYKGEYVGAREMRKHAMWYSRGLPGSAALRQLWNAAESRDDFLRILREYFE